MRTRTAALLTALAIVGVVGALALAAALSGKESTDASAAPEPVHAESSLTPDVVLFGDTVRARVDLTVDRDRVDPDHVRVLASFAPWTLVNTTREREDAGRTTHLRTTFTLRCLTLPCLPQRRRSQLDFDAARVVVAAAGGELGAQSIRVRWPTLEIHSRIDVDDYSGPGALASTPWRADVLSLPAVSYRVTPWGLRGLALGGGILLLIAGAALLYLALPKRGAEPEPEPPPPPPPPPLSALEQALILLEQRSSGNGENERRRALELVADVLTAHGDDAYARAARTLAWSGGTPEDDAVRPIVVHVRSLQEEEASNGHAD